MRNTFIDSLKGLAILLVVWGHCIQFCGHMGFYENLVFITIYSFHMPLFMAISGYLFYIGVNRKSLKDIIVSRLKQLIIPWLLWSIIVIPVFYQKQLTISLYTKYLPTLLWFLPTLFICSLIVASCEKLSTKGWLYSITSFLVLLFLPDSYGIVCVKYLYPYFAIAFYCNKIALSGRLKDGIGILATIIAVAMIYKWRTEYFVYVSGMDFHTNALKHKLVVILYRYVAGAAGTIAFIYIIDKINKPSKTTEFLALLGNSTLGIYILSVLFNPYLKYIYFEQSPAVYNYLYTPLLAVLVSFVCLGATRLIKMVPITNKLLLGAKY